MAEEAETADREETITAATLNDTEQHRLMRKVILKIVPVVSVGFLLSYLDRTNIAMAALTMNKALGLNPAAYGWAVSLFFVTYIVFEIPSNLALQRFGARLWLTRIMVTWGLITCATALSWNAASLFGFRLLLGMAEAGFTVGVVYYFTLWIPRSYRTRVLGLFLLMSPLSQLIGGPFGGALLSMDGFMGLAGWQWLFILEGIPSILVGVWMFLHLESKPADASWLGDKERHWFTGTLAAEGSRSPALHGTASALRNGEVWRLSLCYLLMLLGILGTGYWLPLMIRTLVSSNGIVGLLTMVPAAAAVFGVIFWTSLAQRIGWAERYVALAAALGGAGLLLAGFTNSPLAAFTGIIISFIGLWSAFALFWALVTRVLVGDGSATAIALISAVGSLSGVFGPYALGWLFQVSGTYRIGIAVMSFGAVAAAGVALTFKTSTATDSTFGKPLRA